jgi:hypothetical protein
LYRPFEIRPQVMVNLTDKVFMFPDKSAKTVQVLLKAGMDNVSGEVSLNLPKTWKITPESIPFQFKQNNEELKVSFQVTPPATNVTDQLKAVVKTSSGQTHSKGILTINYPHIPIQTLFPEAVAKAVRMDVQIAGKNIGYIMGAGDDVPGSLRQIGYVVTLLSESDLQKDVEFLSQFDAIVAGVRAYNTEERLKFYQPKLLQYVNNGGTLLIQYNVSSGLVTEEIGPYPFRLSRERVTVEEAPVTFLKPNHPVLATPNKISQKDFEGWVQERGLYFADSLDTRYETILTTKDPGEKEKAQNNGLFITPYGKGRFVYTGYAFFRQLPAGVPGAYRFFANLIARKEAEQ